jgi:SAM-dependent methyltransferase
LNDQEARCPAHSFPVERGIPRLLPADLMGLREGRRADDLRARTYRSFAFEWQRFSHQLAAYERNFHWYLEPLAPSSFGGRTVLDAGCGMGRHTFHFLRQGARVVAVDASEAIDAAARNNPSGSALFVQGDVLQLPVAGASFDLACCLGVLHHVEDTARGLRQLIGAVRPGGWILVFLYHDPSELGWVRGTLLRLVSAARRVTTRLPHGLLHGLTWLLAAGLLLLYVGPLRLLSRIPGLAGLRSLPLGQYTDYPFRVLWNDQFDRFSAPLEKRYRRAQVEALLREAGLVDLRILGGYGWRAAGRKPNGV